MVRTLDDYIDRLSDMFPEVPKDEIIKIIKTGIKEMSSFCIEGIDYAVDYKDPGASFMIASNTKHSGRPLKTKRRDCFIDSRRKIKAIMDETGMSKRDACIEKNKRKKCQKEKNILEIQDEI